MDENYLEESTYYELEEDFLEYEDETEYERNPEIDNISIEYIESPIYDNIEECKINCEVFMKSILLNSCWKNTKIY